MYYDTIEEAIKAKPDCTHVLESKTSNRIDRYAAAYLFGSDYCVANRSFSVAYKKDHWSVAHTNLNGAK